MSTSSYKSPCHGPSRVKTRPVPSGGASDPLGRVPLTFSAVPHSRPRADPCTEASPWRRPTWAGTWSTRPGTPEARRRTPVTKPPRRRRQRTEPHSGSSPHKRKLSDRDLEQGGLDSLRRGPPWTEPWARVRFLVRMRANVFSERVQVPERVLRCDLLVRPSSFVSSFFLTLPPSLPSVPAPRRFPTPPTSIFRGSLSPVTGGLSRY